MIQKQNEQNVSRRNFLRAAVVTTAAATATGAGAALMRSGTQSLPPPPIASGPIYDNLVSGGNEAAAELFGQFAALQADNVRLQARLDALRRQLKSEQTDAATVDQAMAVELNSATEQVSILSGLLSLYEQLDDVNLSELLEEGIASVSTGISDLFSTVPDLSEGIEVGREALDNLDQQIPLLQESRLWLDEQMDRLQGHFSGIEQLLQSAAEAAAPFLQLLNEWIQDVLKWLPFGLGERAGRILRSIRDLLDETPRTIAGLDSNVAQPMDVWLGNSGEEVPLRKHLVKPIREQLIQSASQTVAQAEQMQLIYQSRLADPAIAAVNNRRAVRERIALYRSRYQM